MWELDSLQLHSADRTPSCGYGRKFQPQLGLWCRLQTSKKIEEKFFTSPYARRGQEKVFVSNRLLLKCSWAQNKLFQQLTDGIYVRVGKKGFFVLLPEYWCKKTSFFTAGYCRHLCGLKNGLFSNSNLLTRIFVGVGKGFFFPKNCCWNVRRQDEGVLSGGRNFQRSEKRNFFS